MTLFIEINDYIKITQFKDDIGLLGGMALI